MGPGGFNIIGQDTFHRVELHESDAWTLFYRRGTSNGWGFIESTLPQYRNESHWRFREHHEQTDSEDGWDGVPVAANTNRQPVRV